ncbi:FadR/GntR family transcriptional regulator [Chengkuizengella axinellae]|uniref:FadR/GntR family transcriptional regulator n=1 Tax=Chengkuizengella axinellae TaxID=3064388 RepID=A0ABT9J3E9_9BACL|nr:FadR/GntR family transcriptional regulator [Chengkuizengella sp. 2205SS18-9]MDP5275535.1 FadR/GntR family transcriptional regulator [Chengkuizengella sp. 2205SS18-9]
MEGKANLGGIFNKVQPVRGFEDIAMQIQEAIYSGQLKSGDRLPSERDLAEMFQVSRSTVREAIRVLEAEKVVEVRRGVKGGIIIVEPKPEQVGRSIEALIRFRGATAEELGEFRTDFEGQTAALAAKRATPEQLIRLQEITDLFRDESTTFETPWAKLVEYDLMFHEEVANASHNKIRVAIMMATHGILQKSSLSIEKVDTTEWRKQQAVDLQSITDAITSRDQKKAQQMMEDHVSRNVNKYTDS